MATMEARIRTVESALGAATRVEGNTLIYNKEDFGRWLFSTPHRVMRKRASWVQPVEQPGGNLPTREGTTDATGGLLCASVGEAGELIDPYLLKSGLAGLASVYEPIDPAALADPESDEFIEWRAANPDRVMDASTVVGAEGADPEMSASLLARPYILFFPTRRHVWDAEWTEKLEGLLTVSLDWIPWANASEPGVVAQVPGTDDIYFVARDRFVEDRWQEVGEHDCLK